MKKITICGKNIEKFTVIYDPVDGPAVEFAAKELVKYVEKATGKTLPVITPKEDCPMNAAKFKIGPTVNHISFDLEGEEDFVIYCYPDIVRIGGGQPRGTLYGVYDFLENEIGWRFLTSDCEVLTDENGSHDVPPFRRKWKPSFEWRDVCSAVYWDADIAAKRRINSSYARNIGEERGGSFFYPGRFVHTMESLLEVPQHQQPCFSDPDNLNRCIESVRTLLRGYPNARVISVTQNDCDMDEETYCTCPRCAAIDEEDGSHAGSLLRFVNSVAEAIEDEFPRVKIMTLAYLHTLKCPKITRPRRNVIMEFAPMTMNFVRPVTDPCNADFISEFENWSKVSNNIYIWDYIANFSFTVPIFPNFGVIRDNLRYYASHNVTGMFLEGDNYIRHGECTDLCELRGYLLSKLLCDPNMSEEDFLRHRDEFLCGYYGPGGTAIGDYIDIITEIASAEGRFVGCFQNPTLLFDPAAFVSRLPKMEMAWNKAESAAAEAGDPDQISRVERSRLNYTFLKLLYAFDLLNGNDQTRTGLLEENKKFYDLLKKYNIRPRGMTSELPEVTDFDRNAATQIYW